MLTNISLVGFPHVSMCVVGYSFSGQVLICPVLIK